MKFSAKLEEYQVGFLGEALNDICSAHGVWRENNDETGDWIVEWILENKLPVGDLMARLALQAEIHNFDIGSGPCEWEDIPDIDWLQHVYEQYPPFSIGPFFIHGSHFVGDPPQGQIPLQIDAATAFGSGEHETTKACLQAMLELKAQGVCPWNVLDMGTGSGILAIAAWKLWKTPIVAVDIEEESVAVSKRHCEFNDVPLGKASVRVEQSAGFQSNTVQQKKPYELIIANILAAPLKAMAGDLAGALDENGYAVLSGLLGEQAEDVMSAYTPHGLELKKRYDIGEWSALVLHKAAA